MTMTNSKNSLIDKYDSHDYGEETLNDFKNSINLIKPQLNAKSINDRNETSKFQNSNKLLGLTTAVSNGGTGIKGFVFTSLHKPSGKTVVVKRYQVDEEHHEGNSFHNSQEHFNENVTFIMLEVIRMRQIRHANILPVLSSFVVNTDICIVTPLMKMGSARDLLDTHFPEGLPENIITIILRDILSALVHLHSKQIIHRSIRASHILLDPNKPMVKLTGLRYACNLQDPPGQGLPVRYDYPLHVVATNLNWLSPEILEQNLKGYNEKSDIYSLAVTACEMANGLVPFSEMPGTLMLIEKLRGAAPKLLDKTTFEDNDPSEYPNTNGTNDKERDESKAMATNENNETEYKMEDTGLTTSKKPGDSGVGVSVGSSYNMTSASSKQLSQAGTLQALSSRASLYANRVFSDDFHDFVADLSIVEPDERPSAYELLNIHPFIRQFIKKTGGDKAKNQSDAIISSFLTSIKDKESPNSFRAQTNENNDSCNGRAEGELPKININNIEWIF